MDTYSQAQLVLDLCKVFPAFANYWERAAEEDPPSDSLHAVYMSFLPFLGSCSATPEQWRLLATIVSREVSAGGARENAVDTCMLEHLHQVKLNKVLRPLLSDQARMLVRT